MASLEAVRKRLEVLSADISMLERMLPPEEQEEIGGHVADAKAAVAAALAVFKNRDRNVRETYGRNG
jgi:hypothetical protein